MKSFWGVALALGIGSASALAQTQTPVAGTMHSETTKESHPNGKSVKTRSETVVGIVKDYNAGKKIVVTGPKNKDYSFDLDENAGVTGDIAVGTRVKVTYTKTEDGQKVTTVAPYVAKKKKKMA